MADLGRSPRNKANVMFLDNRQTYYDKDLEREILTDEKVVDIMRERARAEKGSK